MMLLKEQMEIIRRHQQESPVRVVRVATDLGLNVFRTALPANISGMLKKDKNATSGYSIFVNETHSNVRKRFTIAHEIGHFILHENLLKDGIVEDALLRAEGLSNAVEAAANGFAADILMPWHLIKDLQARGINTIESLADALEVSRDAMSIRLLGVSYARAQELNAAE